MIEIVIAMTAGTMVETAIFVVTGTGIAAIGIGIATGTTAVTVIGTGRSLKLLLEMLYSGNREELVLASGVEIVRQNSERSPAVLGIMHWLGAPSFG